MHVDIDIDRVYKLYQNTLWNRSLNVHTFEICQIAILQVNDNHLNIPFEL